MRTKGVAFVLTFNGAAAIVANRVATVEVGDWDVRAAAIIQVIALLLIVPLFVLDLMYTRFLLAAVSRAEAIERLLGQDLSFTNDRGKVVNTVTLSRALERAIFRNLATFWVIACLYGILAVTGIFLAVIYATA